MSEELFTYVKRCPDCGNKTKVVDVREQDNGTLVRSRLCEACNWRFRTVELEECVLDVVDLLDEVDKLKKEVTRVTATLNSMRGAIRNIIDEEN